MTFWADPKAEPKRTHRWAMYIGGMPIYWLSKATKPSFEIGVAEVNFINHTFKYPGRVKWNPVTATLIDTHDPDSANTWMELLFAAGYQYPENVSHSMVTMAKANAINAIGNILIAQIDHTGKANESWTLVNGWFSKVNFGSLDYGSDTDVVTMEVEIQYDYARIQAGQVIAGIPFGGGR